MRNWYGLRAVAARSTARIAIVAMAMTAAACGSDASTSTGGGQDAATSQDGTALDAAGDDTAAGDDASTSDAGADASADAAPTCPAATGERPSRRSEQVGAFDPKTNKLVMFGGSFGVPQNCGFPTATFEDETWIYDVACDSWTLSKAAGPKGRVRATAAWVESLGKIVVFGGRWRNGSSGNYTLLKDLWAYDSATDSWSEISDGAGMSARFNHTMVSADELGKLLVFGGNTSPSGLVYTATNDVWSYSFSDGVWEKVTVAGQAPPKRFFSGGLWDGERKRFVIFGGADETLFADTAKYKDDLWAVDFSGATPTWKRLDLKASTKPDARFWGEIVLNKPVGHYVLFGGHDDAALGNRNDLWAFDAKADDWGTLIYGDTFNKPANGFCSFPPDFTKMEDNTPERRNGGLVTGGGGGLWIAGGKTDCGVIDDLWRYDFAKGTWEQRTPATVGEACVRKGGLSCNDYCF